MDKKYNGFNNGRDRSDGVGGREVNHGKQETMTKEQILEKQKPNIEYPIYYHESNVLDAMEEYAQQQLSAERERAGKLVGALKSTILIFNKLGYPKTAEFVKQTIAEYDTQTKS